MTLLPRCAILLSLLILNQWTSILSQGITIEYPCSLTNWPVRCPSTVDPVCASTPRTCSQEPCPQFTEFSNSCNACKTQGITTYTYGKCQGEDTSINEESTQEELRLNIENLEGRFDGNDEEFMVEEEIVLYEDSFNEETGLGDLEECVFEEGILIPDEDEDEETEDEMIGLEECVFEEAILIGEAEEEEDNDEELEQCVFEEAIFIPQEEQEFGEDLEQCVFEEAILINYEEEGNTINDEGNIKQNTPDGEDILIEGDASNQIISNP